MKSLTGIDLLHLQSRLVLRKDGQGQSTVLDPVRRKYVRATPEEIVRQLWLLYFLQVRKLNPKLIAVERAFTLNQLVKRFDLVIFNNQASPVLLAEFKSPGLSLNQDVFDQIAQYNMELHVPYALVSNGAGHYCFKIDNDKKGFEFLADLPFEDAP